MPPHDRPAPARGPQPLLLALRELRWSQLAHLARYRLAMRSGWIRRRSPSTEWDEWRLETLLRPGVPVEPAAYVRWRAVQPSPHFFFDIQGDMRDDLARVAPEAGPAIDAAEAVLAGRFSHFGQPPMARGFPPDWGAFAPLDPAPPADLTPHWTSLVEDELGGDIKLLWEISRFGWVFPLVRAYRRTGEARFAEACFTLCASWREANAPNRGPNWLSAQEAAIRLLSLTFAFHGLWPALESRPSEAAALLGMITAHADRIPLTLDYARAQGNNHFLTEAAALLTAGLLFPELRSSAHFAAVGRRGLETGLKDQFFDDGGYVQHSANYHRLALQAGVWSAALAARQGRPLSEAAVDALRRGVVCLGSLVDPATGRVPNFGPNDGALLLQLSSCEAQDYRPAVQAASRFLLARDAFAPGPWDEEACWLGVLPPGAERKRAILCGESFPQAGLHRLGADTTRAWLRAVAFRGRPGHSDQLHVDLWRNGRPIAQDAGTFLYSGAPPWDNALDKAAVHNTVVVDGREPMIRRGRFLWLDWSHAATRGRRRDPSGRVEALLADHDGYRRLSVMQQRTIARFGDSGWLVVDDIFGQGEHEARLGWLLADGAWMWRPDGASLARDDGPIALRIEPSAARVSVYRGGECVYGEPLAGHRPTWGWVSPTYAVRHPAPFLTATVRGVLPLRITSWWSFEDLNGVAVDWRPPAPRHLPFSRLIFGEAVIEA